jgi:type II secretory ATPase GspE/PulE/Tfp pilus assembly ATPase PilB-like protein
VHNDIGLTFASVLRSFLRQDPDIILVGEIRDEETAEMAAQAAMTGHLVFATVHTNDSFSAIGRLKDLGMGPSQIHDTLRGVFSQRLVRSLCMQCREEYDAKDELNEIFGADIVREPLPLFRPPHGSEAEHCSGCEGVGYTGRIVIPELWEIGCKEREMISADAARALEYAAEARKQGMRSMLDYALGAIRSGETSLHECTSRVFSIADLRGAMDEVCASLRRPASA